MYETKGRAICNDCGADITDLGEEELTEHICNHALNGGKGSYRVDDVKIQTGTKTVRPALRQSMYPKSRITKQK